MDCGFEVMDGSTLVIEHLKCLFTVLALLPLIFLLLDFLEQVNVVLEVVIMLFGFLDLLLLTQKLSLLVLLKIISILV